MEDEGTAAATTVAEGEAGVWEAILSVRSAPLWDFRRAGALRTRCFPIST